MTNSIRSKNVRRSSISMRTFWNGFYGTLNLLLVIISVLCITPRVETVSVPKIIFAFLPPPRFRDIHHTQRRVDCPASKKKSDWQKMMDEQGISSSQLNGSGKNGRITKQDVLSAMAAGFPAEHASGWGGTRDKSPKKMSLLRRKVAERLVAVKSETAMLTTFNEVDMQPIMDIRRKYKKCCRYI